MSELRKFREAVCDLATDDVPRCLETHNPGVWPYVSRCVLTAKHDDQHEDRHGNKWESSDGDQ